MIISGIAFILTFWNYNNFDNHMVTRLFKLYKPNVDSESKMDIKTVFTQSEFMRPRFLYNPKEYCKDLVPSFLSCGCASKYFGASRLERGFEKAREKMLKEINIIEIIKSRRYSCAALKLLLTKEQ